MLSACSGNHRRTQNITPNDNEEHYANMSFVEQLQESVFPIDDNTDWNKPLYSIGENNDTIEKWTYLNTDSGLCVIHNVYPDSFYSEGMDKTVYDKRNRLIAKEISNKNGIYFTIRYYYDGNVRIGNGKRNYEGSEVDVKEISYYLDSYFKYDTLTQTFMGIKDVSMEMTGCQKSKYEKIGNEYRIVEKRFYSDPNDTVSFTMGDKRIYRYNSQNLLVGECVRNVGEYGTTRFTYKNNSMEWSNTGTGATVYYDKK
ncbi:MAG: hypothetical protein IJ150_04960 [Bacteroidales bacterium]|nr:hypothetical protein [Bacteroidales bacterium]